MLTPPSQLVVISKSRQLQVTGTGWCLKRIRKTLKDMEETVNQVVVYTCRYIDPQQLMDQLRPLMGIPADQTAAADGSISFSFEATGTNLIIMGKPDKIAKAQDILKATDVNPDPTNKNPPLPGPPRTEVYQIIGPDPTTALQVISSMLDRSDQRPGGHRPEHRVPDRLRDLPGPRQGQYGHQEDAGRRPRFQPGPHRHPGPAGGDHGPEEVLLADGHRRTSDPDFDIDPVGHKLIVRGTEAQIAQIKSFLVSWIGAEKPAGADRGSPRT